MSESYKQRILLISHGETVAQHDGVFSDPDTMMTDNGRIEVTNAAKKLKYDNRKFKKIYCSPLPRAQETAKIFSEILQIPIETIPELVQQDFGIYTGLRKTRKNYENYLSDFVAENRRCGSVSNFLENAEKAISHIIDNGEDSLVVAHRFTWIGFEVFFLGKPFTQELLRQEEKEEFII